MPNHLDASISSRDQKPWLRLRQKEALLGWLFVMPALIGFGVFTFGSILYSFWLSLTRWDLLTPPRFIGVDNYVKAFNDPRFYQYFGNTVYFVVFLVPIVLICSLLLAILVNGKVGILNRTYRVSLFVPSIVSTVAVSMVWIWIFNPSLGLINNVLFSLGIDNPPTWLASTTWSKPALIIMRIWQMTGYYMIIYLAGLQTIPENLYEAAQIDGADKWHQFRHITVPMLSNTTFVVAILLVVEAFNMFESIFIMTEGGPLGSTSTIMYYIYEQGFINFNMGYASALAWIFFAVLMGLTLVQYKFRNEQSGE